MKCAGVKVRGYWRGYSCGAVAKYKLRGKHYCGSHLAIARDEPHLFKEAIKAEERAALRRHRQEKARLAAEAEKEKQLDAFDKPCCGNCASGTGDCDVNPLKPHGH